jgi:tRNA A-37 threonylcarbamoyl transferase component Bud32
MQFVCKKKMGKSVKWKIKDEIDFDPEAIFSGEDTLRSDRLCSVIKDNNVRCSMFVPEGAGNSKKVFLKIYKQRDWNDAFKYFFLTSKAKSEWHALNRFSRMGVSAPKPLAVCEERQFGILKKSCLFIEAISNALTLNAFENIFFCPPLAKNTFALKRQLIRRVAGLIGSIHNKSIFYRDLHGGNILVYLDEKLNMRFSFIDLHKAKFLPFLPMWMRIHDLAKLSQAFSPKKTDAFYFLKNYANSSPAFKQHINKYAEAIERKALRLHRRHIRSRTKRCLIKSSGFFIFKGKKQKVYVRKVYKDMLEVLLKYIKNPSKFAADIIKKTKKSELSCLSINSGEQAETICVKKDLLPGFFYNIKNIIRASRAKRSWVASHGLRVRNISTPESIALIENKKGWFVKECVYIYKYIGDACPLNNYILKIFSEKTQASEKKKKTFVSKLAQYIRSIHSKGVYHSDLKSNNILVTEKGNDDWSFYLVDLDRVFFKKRLSLKKKVNNLAQINASVADCICVSDRIYFFNEYAKGSCFIRQKKKIYRQIIKIGGRKTTHYYGLDFKAK